MIFSRKNNLLALSIIIIYFFINADHIHSFEKLIENNIEIPYQYQNIKFDVIGNNKTNISFYKNIAKIYLSNGINDEAINKFLLALYKTNLFMDIKIDFFQAQQLLKINVVENKIVRNFEFKGVKNISDPELQKLVKNKRMLIFNFYEFEQTAKKLHKYYVDNGYTNVEIEKNIRDISSNLVDVTINVKKNKKPKIHSINFIGNKHFTKKELSEAIFFQEDSPIKIFSSKTSYKESFDTQNAQALKDFYLNHGFIDFKLLNRKIDFDIKNNSTKLKFEIEEGNQYKITKINIDSNIKLSKKINELINKNLNTIYNQQKINISEREIKNILNEAKYFSEITISRKKLDNNNLVLDYKIIKTPANYIEKIIILGNNRTKDSVIRNQITLHEGDVFDVSELQTSYRRIYNLGFFEMVNLDYTKNKNGKIILTITVSEKKTGELNLGAGYSSINGLFGKIYYAQGNFMGSGDNIDFGIERGANSISLEGSYYKNNIFDSLLGGGFGLFYQKADNDILDFKNKEYGGKVMTSIPLYKDLSMGLRYLLKSSNIYDVKDNASEYIKNHQGKINTSSLLYKINYDKRNIADYPTDGYLLFFSQENAGLGGDKYFVSSEFGANFYKKLFYLYDLEENENAVVLQFKHRFGYLFSYHNYDLRIDDRYFLNDVRGFDMISGISPRDPENKAVGGDEYYNGSLQIEFPIKFIKELELKGHFFLDYGNLINKNKFLLNPALDIDKQLMHNIDKIRISSGFGFSFQTPIAPIEIDFATPIIYDKSDIISHVYFAIGKKF